MFHNQLHGFERQDYKMKIGIPTFNGKLDVEVFLDWIKDVANFFNYMDTPEEKKVKSMALKLRVAHLRGGGKGKGIKDVGRNHRDLAKNTRVNEIKISTYQL